MLHLAATRERLNWELSGIDIRDLHETLLCMRVCGWIVCALVIICMKQCKYAELDMNKNGCSMFKNQNNLYNYFTYM